MTAKEALLELIPELGEDEAERIPAFANSLYDDEPLTDEERQELFKIRAEMASGDALPWPEVKRQLGVLFDPDEASEEDLKAVRDGRAAFERGECIDLDALRKLLAE